MCNRGLCRLWCADCWSGAGEACRGRHRISSRRAAEEEVDAAFAAARREVQRLQLRKDALLQAREKVAAVLELSVEEVDELDTVGGKFKIALSLEAADLTDQEKDDVCRAFNSSELDYSHGEDSVCSGSLEKALFRSVFQKLPNHVPGQTLRDGTVLVKEEGSIFMFDVYDGEAVPFQAGNGARVLGRVVHNFDALYGTVCDGDNCYNPNCSCKYGSASAKLNDARFLA